MRAVIFANGEFSNRDLAKDEIGADDLVIAADGGARHCLNIGISPAFVIGDFDSLSEDEQSQLEANGAKLIRHPARKDKTDLELALLHAKSVGATDVIIYGGLGARWDQSIANILLTCNSELRAMDFVFISGKTRIHAIHDDLTFTGNPGDTVSLIPLTQEVAGITTSNLEYPLTVESLEIGTTRGVSNVLTAKDATISIRSGILLCFHEYKS